jgi:hypothetical protein
LGSARPARATSCSDFALGPDQPSGSSGDAVDANAVGDAPTPAGAAAMAGHRHGDLRVHGYDDRIEAGFGGTHVVRYRRR